MKQLHCISCNEEITESSNFCPICGAAQKCTSCKTALVKNAKFCINCGTPTSLWENNNEDKKQEKNILKYHKTNDEIFCEVSLTNEVGKEGISGLIHNLTTNVPTSYQRIEGEETLKLPNKYLDNEKSIEITQIENKDDKNNNNDFSSFKKEDLDLSESEHMEFPHIKDVEMNIECKEADWILIYAFYISEFGKTTFSPEKVKSEYITKRKTDSNVKNYSKNWKSLFKLFLSTVNDNEIKFKMSQLCYVKEIITGKKNLKNTKKSNHNEVVRSKINLNVSNVKPRKVANGNIRYSVKTELNLYPQGKDSLSTFYGNYTPSSNMEIILIFVYYLQKIYKYESINIDALYTCYKELGLPVPNIKKTLNNIQKLKGWVATQDYNDLHTTISGDNYLEFKINKK